MRNASFRLFSTTKTIVGSVSGNSRYQSLCQGSAPSRAATSYRSRGMLSRLAEKSRKSKPKSKYMPV